MTKVNINERSWAIDLISEINQYISNKQIRIRHAGGESTLRNMSGSLFPDVLLFGDSTKGDILQGWELKMPDTSITDVEFLNNARTKAELLRLDSFLLWNVSSAVLYKNQNGTFTPLKSWEQLSNIKTRKDVDVYSGDWKKLLKTIIDDLNAFFENGQLSNKKLVENLSLDEFIDVILENTLQTATELQKAATKNRVLGAEINSWWSSSKTEYNDAPNPFNVLSRLLLTDWLVKLVFAHIIKRDFTSAKEVEKIDFNTSIEDGIKIFETLSKTCDFWNIFSSQFGQKHLSEKAWDQLIQINQFLNEINIQSIDINILHSILQNSILIAKRKVAGQYSTPQKLAELLVKITIEDVTENVLDSCCGTGTIIKEAYKLMEASGISQNNIAKNIWASDKYAFPLQLTTLALTKPDNFGLVLHIFREDVVNLQINQKIDFINPKDGNVVSENLPSPKYIISNLPFVQQEDLETLNPTISEINDWIKKELNSSLTLDGRSDLFVYIPFYLYRILKADGKIGIILSNAWLGTDYGKSFIKLLNDFFVIETVVISGKGKWFDNANVVTTVLVLKKKSPGSISNSPSKFCVLDEKIEAINDIDEIADSILLGKQSQNVSISRYSPEQIAAFENTGMSWSAFFADINWINAIQPSLLPLRNVFKMGRGERRGWNEMFYPEKNHGIEADYIRPILKNLRACKGLIAATNKEAFCCSLSVEALTKKKHTGALNWIKKFEKGVNEKGKPLIESLKRPNHFWYEMKTDTLADFAVNINFDKSLFIAKLPDKSFVDQRVVSLIINEEYEKEDPIFLLALLNSTVSMFYLEALGFGRGLGALDLSSKKFAKGYRMLNPDQINNSSKLKIIEAFKPLLKRNRLDLYKELTSQDRIEFESILYKEYGILNHYPSVEKALKQLFKIRFAVND